MQREGGAPRYRQWWREVRRVLGEADNGFSEVGGGVRGGEKVEEVEGVEELEGRDKSQATPVISSMRSCAAAQSFVEVKKSRVMLLLSKEREAKLAIAKAALGLGKALDRSEEVRTSEERSVQAEGGFVTGCA